MDDKKIINALQIIGVMTAVILVTVLAIAHKLEVFWWQ